MTAMARGSVVIIVLLLHLVKITYPSPASPLPASQGVVLSEFIKHYEPAVYDKERTQRSHKRLRRAPSHQPQQPLRIHFSTHHREFRLKLYQDREVFANDVSFVTGSGRKVHFDPGKAYIGTLEDDDDSVVRGVVTEDGLFDGTVTTRAEVYYVEPVRRYRPDGGLPFHSVVYKSSDVLHPDIPACASQMLAEKQKQSRDDNIEESSAESGIHWRSKDRVHHHHSRTDDFKYRRKEPFKSDELYDDFTEDFKNRYRRSRPDRVLYQDQETYVVRRHNRSSIVTRRPMKAISGTGSEADEEEYRLKSRTPTGFGGAVDPAKTNCMLYLQADHLFFQKYGTEEACIEVMTRHVQRVNAIYKTTDFNLDGKSDNITFMIKRIKVHTQDSLNDPSYRFPGNYGVEKFLELFSEEDYDAFCLAYMFTYRDFEMGTLGLAWTGDLKNAGGVCEKNGHYRGSMKSLNTGIVTLLNYGKHVPPAVSHVTLAHEIGHNFGSPHDPEMCTPGGEDGNFIMFARATSGDKKNNNKFSPCSLNSINPVLNTKARSVKGCFTEPQTAICGNGVVESGEQCDCGWEEDCKEDCCYPQKKQPSPDQPPCHLTPHSVCSPSQGPCCTAECSLKFGDKCREDNGCRDASFCDGRGPHCPPSINKPNKTVCNDEFVCFMGECTGSICLAYGLESCQCIPGPTDPPTKACELCCKQNGENYPCMSSFDWNNIPYDVPDMYSKPGTPCNDYNGYCDVFQKCREVDPSGPLATLRKLLLSDESIASFKRWVMDRWYYALLIITSVLLILILSTRLLGKTTDMKLRGVTIVHSSTTETVRLPDGEGGNNMVVHPVARSKLPLKRKVRDKRRKRIENRKAKKPTDESQQQQQQQQRKVRKKSTEKPKGKVKKAVIDYSAEQKSSAKTLDEDPFGKVRNWLLNSHIDRTIMRKSKSSPAGFPPTEHRSVATTQPAQQVKRTVQPVSSSKEQVKLQVTYKPPFKFSVKLRKPTQVATRVVKEINSKVNKRPRAAILVKERKGRGARKRKTQREDSKDSVVADPQVVGECSKSNSNDSNSEKSNSNECNTEKTKSNDSNSDNKEKQENVTEPQPVESKPGPSKVEEPVYENADAARLSSASIGNIESLDLLRMTSVECRSDTQLPLVPEDCKKMIRGQSFTCASELDKRKKKEQLRKDQKKIRRSEDLMRFPSSEPSQPTQTDSNLHTVPSDLEGLLSDTEYLFSDA